MYDANFHDDSKVISFHSGGKLEKFPRIVHDVSPDKYAPCAFKLKVVF
jgi:hypothetical protein